MEKNMTTMTTGISRERLDKMRTLIAILDVAEDAVAQSSFMIIRRQMLKAGVTWRDLLEESAPAEPMRKASGFEDVFSDLAAQFRAPAAPVDADGNAHRPAARRRKNLQGSEIPGAIAGTIKVDDERLTSRGSRMMVVTVEADDAIYGPMTIFDIKGIDAICKAMEAGTAYVTAKVRASDNPRHLPTITRIDFC